MNLREQRRCNETPAEKRIAHQQQEHRSQEKRSEHRIDLPIIRAHIQNRGIAKIARSRHHPKPLTPLHPHIFVYQKRRKNLKQHRGRFNQTQKHPCIQRTLKKQAVELRQHCQHIQIQRRIIDEPVIEHSGIIINLGDGMFERKCRPG